MELKKSLQYIRGVGPRKASLFARLGIETIEDACFFLPRRYEDRRYMKRIIDLTPGQATVIGEVQMATVVVTPKNKRRIFELVVSDSSGLITAKWFKFHEKYMKEIFKPGQRVILSGTLQINSYVRWGKEMHHPDYEFLTGDEEDLIHCGRIVPVYHATEGLNQRSLRTVMKRIIDEYADYFEEILPKDIIAKYGLIPRAKAISNAHFPEAPYDNLEQLNNAASLPHKRLIFEELFLLQLGLAMRKNKAESGEKGIAFKSGVNLLNGLWKILPFGLTGAQKRVIEEIKADMMSPRPMHRLLQGDVGSGKTIVALACVLICVESGFQAAIMAPTEILAEQHYLKTHHLLEQLGIRAVLLKGDMRKKEKQGILEQIENNEAQVIIGTHALIQKDVKFSRLGFAVIDEQHKFGVAQRMTLQNKAKENICGRPDTLVMTATPIPRSLSLTVYGDLSLSVLDELPPGRTPVRTHLRYDKDRQKIYSFLKNEVQKGGQVYIVYPLVEESEKLELRAATEMYEHFHRDVFPHLKLGLIHGRMSGEEKEIIMGAFRNGEIGILVSTTVIEVGVDVPNASIMLIEHAERFGLAQLHQLRGRVGRGSKESHCILLAHYPITEEAQRRLNVMVNNSDGFAIAEEDLIIRGPGDFWGTRQSGLPDLRIAHILRDSSLLEAARREAFVMIDSDPVLNGHKVLLGAVNSKWEAKLSLVQSG